MLSINIENPLELEHEYVGSNGVVVSLSLKKYLTSPQWLRDLKFKKRPFWRLDKFRLSNIIENGGWHFCNLKKPEFLLYKYQNLCETDDPIHFKEKIDEFGSKKLVDGGVLNPVPIAPTFGDNTDLTIAVNLGGSPIEVQNEDPPLTRNATLQNRIKNFIHRLKIKGNPVTEQNWSMYTIADKAFDAMQSTIARQKLAVYPPDIEIEIPRNICGTLDFHRSKEMIEYGYKKAKYFVHLHLDRYDYCLLV